MRKYGLGFTIFGGALGAVLLLVRQTAWYRSASATNLSETAEFVEAAFWAGWIILALGLLMLLLSLRRTDEPAQPQQELPEDVPAYDDGYEYAAEAPYEAPYDGAAYAEPYENTDGAAFYDEPYDEPEQYDAPMPEREPFRDVWEPDDVPDRDPDATRRIPDVSLHGAQWTCEICGCQNPEFSGICAVCGSARGSNL